MRGVLEEQLPFNERFIEHIDLCLTCRACERVCPNSVAYGELVDGMRTIIETKRNSGFLHKLALRHLITRPRLLETIGTLLRLYRNTGAQTLIRKTRLLKRLSLENLDQHLPALDQAVHWQTIYPALGKQTGIVGLFLGCVARVTDTATLRASIFILNRLGYTVVVPKNQNCCGALHAHSGDKLTAEKLAEQNIQAFANVDVVLSTASGCGAHLGEYDLSEQAAAFAAKTIDINTFLNQAQGWEGIEISPLSAKVSIHDPCTLRNVIRQEQSPYELLKRIPGIEIAGLEGNDQCCGAAGNYFLHFPEMAASLMHDKLDALERSNADYLVTSNIGCALYMRLKNKTNVEILHPVVLLARQMGFKC